jgi:uncharacterized protein (DUF58 family)
VLLGSLEGVAHESGSGWVQVVAALIGGTILIGGVLPGIILLRTNITCLHNPADTSVANPVMVEVKGAVGIRVTPETSLGYHAQPSTAVTTPMRITNMAGIIDATGRLEIPIVPHNRGVLRHIKLEISTAAPFGLIWWHKIVDVKLFRPLYVAPARKDSHSSLPMRLMEPWENQTHFIKAEVGEPRTVRDYLIGDNPKKIHWHLSAHKGSLLVYECEQSAPLTKVLVLSLPANPVTCETQASLAMGTITEVLAQGDQILLCTMEDGGPKMEVVTDIQQGGRRLAAAVPGDVEVPKL